MKTLLQTLKEINGTVLINGKEYLDLSDDVELLATFNAWAWKAKQSSQSEPVAKVIRNSAGQILIQDGKGGSFDMSQYVGQSFYAAPQQAIPSGWISVTDTNKLPKDGESVQVWLPNYGQMVANMTKTEHGVHWWCKGQQSQCYPTHWQSMLPAPDSSAAPTSPIESDK
jgi:hypothetical protein